MRLESTFNWHKIQRMLIKQPGAYCKRFRKFYRYRSCRHYDPGQVRRLHSVLGSIEEFPVGWF